MDPVLVIQPHYDDAVLGCGQLLAGRPDAWVATICAGLPDDPANVLTGFDAHSGFGSALDAMAARRLEDKAALGLLGVERRLELGLIDNGYADHLGLPPLAAHAPTIVRTVEQWVAEFRQANGRRVFAPLGLGHPDHVATSDAVLAASLPRTVELFLYEELPLRVIEPLACRARFDRLPGIGAELVVLGSGPAARKRAALAEYRSQAWAIMGPDGYAAAVECPERYWRVTR